MGREFLIHAPCLVVRRQGNISYTPRPNICLGLVGSFSYTPLAMESVWSFGGWGVSLTRPVLSICLVVRRVRGVSLTRPVLKTVSFVGSGQFLLHAPCCNSVSVVCSRAESLYKRPCWNLFPVVCRVGSLS